MVIKGKMLRDAFISAAVVISEKKRDVDELNVYPVPDGDTGTNMSMTIGNAVAELQRMDDKVTVTAVAAPCIPINIPIAAIVAPTAGRFLIKLPNALNTLNFGFSS